jgi:hypothetical protein
MSLAVKLDENLGRSHVAALQRTGYEADRVHDEGMSGAEDGVVWERLWPRRARCGPRPRLPRRPAGATASAGWATSQYAAGAMARDIRCAGRNRRAHRGERPA